MMPSADASVSAPGALQSALSAPGPVADACLSRDVGWMLAAASADCALIALLVSRHVGYAGFVLGHLIVVALLCRLVVVRRHRADVTVHALAALGALCLGPLGPLGALAATLAAPATTGTTRLLAAWYERIAHSVATDPVSQLCDTIEIGRAIDPDGPLPPSFCRVMTHGSLAQRQALLGLIARGFDVEYLPALKIALTSPEPVIRVQAAAVATKVQVALGRIVHHWCKPATAVLDRLDALGGLHELEACVGSGLLEPADRTLAEAKLADLRAAGVAAASEMGFQLRLIAARDHPRQLAAMKALEHLLVAERRFKALRNWKRLSGPGLLPQYRLRQMHVRRTSHAPIALMPRSSLPRRQFGHETPSPRHVRQATGPAVPQAGSVA